MKKTLSAIALSAVLALGFAGGAVTSANAGVPARNTPAATDNAARGGLIDVQYRHRHGGGHWNHGGGWHHGGGWRHHRYYRGGSGFFLGFGAPYYYDYYRPYYAGPPVYARPRYVRPAYRGYSRAHVRWCYNRYRSYRASDNSFQPYHGPRRQCYSPYR